jgi:hypothetical protein
MQEGPAASPCSLCLCGEWGEELHALQATNRARASRRWPFTTKDTKQHEAPTPQQLVVCLFYSTFVSFVPFVPSW